MTLGEHLQRYFNVLATALEEWLEPAMQEATALGAGALKVSMSDMGAR